MKRPWKTNRCENPACPNQSRGLRKLLETPKGVLLQKRWHCTPECFGQGLGELFARLRSAGPRSGRKPHRVPLGLLMLSQGLISHDKLRAALQAQRESGNGRVGDWLRNQGAATEEQITRALGMQWSLPVYPLDQQRKYLECSHLVPLAILVAYDMVPVQYMQATQDLYVAFSGRVDYTALYGLEQMLECRTDPCLAQQSDIERALDEIRHETRPPEVLIDGLLDPLEMARTTQQHASQVGAREARVVSCGDHIWVRFRAAHGLSNLLFHIPQDGKQASGRSLNEVA